jgi:hypothetical protein
MKTYKLQNIFKPQLNYMKLHLKEIENTETE